MQTVVAQLPDKESMLSFSCRGLLDVAGVKKAIYRHNDQQEAEPAILPENNLERAFTIERNKYTHAVITLQLSDKEAFRPYLPFIENFCSMLAVIFEEKRQHEENRLLLASLEKRVARRTEKLEREIQERKKARKKLLYSNSLTNAALEATADGILIVNRDGKILRWNKKFVDLWNLSETLLETATDQQIIQHASAQMANPKDYFKKVMELYEHPDESSVDLLNLADGRTFERHSQPIKIEGKMIGRFWSFRDITEHIRSEQLAITERDRAQNYLDTVEAIIVALDHRGCITLINRKGCQILGRNEEELVGASWFDTCLPKDGDRDVVLSYYKKLMQGKVGNLEYFENTVVTAQGDLREIAWHNSLLRDETNAITGTLSAGEDITERKQAEEALRQSELRYRNIFNNVQETFYEVSIDGIVLEVSPSVRNLSKGQYSPEDLIGKSLFGLYADYQEREIFLEVLRKKGIVTNYEIRLQNRDGTIVDCSISSRMQLDASGNPISIIGSLVDITQRKQAERALQESETRFKVLHNASFGGISIHDKGIILDCNQGLSEMSGYSMAELIGMNGLLLIAEQSREYVLEKIGSGYEKPYEAIGIRKNGQEFPIRLEGRNIPFRGKTVRIVEFRDITAQKQAEMNRDKLQAELTQAQKMESVGRLAGGVAHDFNNMLSVILGHAELALMQCSNSGPIYDALKIIHSSALRSADLTRQLLAFARKQTVAPKVLNLNDAVTNILNMLQRMIGEDIDLVWRPEADMWSIKIDPSQIDQLLANLCVNARDAIDGVGKITIETKKTAFDQDYCAVHSGYDPGEYAMLAVSDDGCGMHNDTRDQIFEPFFTTKDLGRGTGLGLSTVYGIVKQNGGFINVYSEFASGTTFKIYLPRHKGKTETSVKQKRELLPRGEGEMLLLVEDEESILNVGKLMLEDLGYRVVCASTPSEALRQAKIHAEEIQLLITDVIMPETNGRDLSKLLVEIIPGLKCLFSSGYTANVIAHHGVLDEGVHFLQKPFSIKDLAIKVRAVLEHG